MMNGL